MKFFRFLCLLFLLFAACFAASGGYALSLFDGLGLQSAKPVSDLVTATYEKTLPAAQTLTEVSVKDRVLRFVFLKQAVEKALPRKEYTSLYNITPAMQQAMISIEDNRFYSHWGFDFPGILRATLVNLQYGRIEEGASTITQQLIKNLFLSHEQSFGRKADELLLALDMEARYSKDDILELYLNSIYFGSDFYGITEASRGYFGKRPAELTLAEGALLAGLPNAPSLYSPYVDYHLAKKRQSLVLDAMSRNGFISAATAEKAKNEELSFMRPVK